MNGTKPPEAAIPGRVESPAMNASSGTVSAPEPPSVEPPVSDTVNSMAYPASSRSTGTRSSATTANSSGMISQVSNMVSRASAKISPFGSSGSTASAKGSVQVPGSAGGGHLMFRSYTMGYIPASALSRKTLSASGSSRSVTNTQVRHHSDPEINADTKDLKSRKKQKKDILKWRKLVQKFKPAKSMMLPRISGMQNPNVGRTMSHFQSDQKEWQGQPVHFRAWRSRAPPGVIPFREIDVVTTFWVYCLELPGIADVFRDELQHWSRSSQNARTIFHPQTEQPHIRAGCRGVHHGITSAQGCCTTKNWKLKSADQFYGILQRDADDYVYSLTDEGLYFVDSRAALPKELLSKHAILADGVETVRCAGELRLEFSDGGSEDECTIVLDNRSGTYAPGKHSLDLTRTLLLEHFPDAAVKAINVDEGTDSMGAETMGQRNHRGTTVLREDVSYRESEKCDAAETSYNQDNLAVRGMQSLMSVGGIQSNKSSSVIRDNSTRTTSTYSRPDQSVYSRADNSTYIR